MGLRITVTGQVDPGGQPLTAFTPEGERAWVGPGWDPVYPAGDPTLEPGLVWLAAGAVWVTVDVDDERVRYARVTPGRHAGLVEVRRSSGGVVDVLYDLTALDADVAGLEAFRDAFPAMVRDWSRRLNTRST